MTLNLIFFFALALVAVASALGMLLSKNAIYSALFLILNFATVAVLYLLLSGPFIAMSQVTVYAGAIMVLFLFVIMLLGAEQLGSQPAAQWQRPVAILLAVILVAETGYLLLFKSGNLGSMEQVEAAFGSPQQVGTVLFNQYLLPFEVTSILLLVAIVGAVVLSRRN
jgi:NADH-quinone oxidoreductase subunit J